MLKKITGSKTEEVSGDYRRFRNDELHDLVSLTKYFSGDLIKKNKMGGACST
jgi:hypothetical protein